MWLDTLIIHKFGAVKYSSIEAFSISKDGVFASGKNVSLQRIFPFDEEFLREAIRDGKLNPCDFGTLARLTFAPADTYAPEQNSNLPSLLFLVGDGQGNVKLCDAQFFIHISDRVCGGKDNPACSCGYRRVNHAVVVGNFNLCGSDAFEDITQNF